MKSTAVWKSLCVASAIMSMSVVYESANGQNPVPIVRDDFDDGSITDGQPTSWNLSGGSFSLTGTGDLRISSTGGALAYLLVDAPEASGWSIRARVRRQLGDLVGLDTNGEGAGDAPYALLNGLGALQIGGVGGADVIASANLGLNPDEQDVILQLDVFDGEVKAWAWLPGDRPRSEVPMVSAAVSLPSTMLPAIWSRNFSGDSAAIFRWVEFSTAHIPVVPEPSSFLLLVCAIGSIPFVCRVRMRQRLHCRRV